MGRLDHPGGICASVGRRRRARRIAARPARRLLARPMRPASCIAPEGSARSSARIGTVKPMAVASEITMRSCSGTSVACPAAARGQDRRTAHRAGGEAGRWLEAPCRRRGLRKATRGRWRDGVRRLASRLGLAREACTLCRPCDVWRSGGGAVRRWGRAGHRGPLRACRNGWGCGGARGRRSLGNGDCGRNPGLPSVRGAVRRDGDRA